MEYNFRSIEKKWQQTWKESGVYKVSNESSKPKFYVLDMFPYPSGAGLHVGHPLGYIASDIFARFKRLKGYNVLHPMGYDAFGLPAEQYAIDHGVHPAVSTEANIANFRQQLDNIGFCFDWDREVRTCEPSYYKWTQWIFLELFHAYFDQTDQKAKPISFLEEEFEKFGSSSVNGKRSPVSFSAQEWKGYNEKTRMDILMNFRLAYCGYGEVNWCEALGTVLANDEVVNGVSERGGHPVVKKKLRQWYLRITEYADRLLEGLERIDFSDAMKEMQSNWIGKSSGAEIQFDIETPAGEKLPLVVYTTRPDTIFGVDFMVVAPELELVDKITTPDQKKQVDEYLAYVKSRSERERMAEKKITGVFTGAYALNPFDGRKIPVWASEYVLAGYGTGAIMAVPCGDQRDFLFAKHFNIPITNIIGEHYNGEEANPTKEAKLENSGFLNGLPMREALEKVIGEVEKKGIGRRKVNFKMRDAAFSRQRYWGEPFPIRWIDGTAYPLPADQLPLLLPEVDKYSPGPEGEGPLSNIPEWTALQLETNTMPGYAGSSWYFLRYMDPHNENEFCSRKASDYWGQVDLYIGGTEHAVGHLLYSRMWTKVLYDLGHIGHDEPYKKLVNQGMIQGSSRFVYRVRGTNQFVSAGLKDQYETDTLHVDVNMVDGFELNIDAFRKWRNGEYKDAELIGEDGTISSPLSKNEEGPGVRYLCGAEVEKMSKSKFNTVNPDDLVQRYGADTFRMYEMFLGPVEISKPWDTKGIEGVHRFLKKFWRLFATEEKGWIVNEQAPTDAELKVLHKTIRKIGDDTERFSFNTAVSAFMIATNELADLDCHKKAILEPLVILLTPYAPHICEEIWHQLGNTGTVLDASFPVFEEKYVKESTKDYPIAINGKTRTEMTLALDATPQEVEALVLANEVVQKWLEGKAPKKVIFVKGKMVNVVV
ncbi:MAG: leucine--tRNA ligase [Chitinophagales bacterium]|nr:leucine--tRNA ligase [Chitinophagales bacterium]